MNNKANQNNGVKTPSINQQDGKMRDIMLKSLAMMLCAILAWSCTDNEDPIQDEEEDPVGTVYFEENFESMIWGGDYINQEPGVKGEFIRDENNRYIVDESQPVAECGINTDGCPDFFAIMGDAYKQLRGIYGWDGDKVYERPGYLKIGTAASRDAFLRTPPLEEIGDGSVDVDVTLDLAIWGGSSQTLYINIVNDGIASVSQLQVPTTDSWTTREFTVMNATKDTRIEINSDPTQTGRFFLSSITVTRSE